MNITGLPIAEYKDRIISTIAANAITIITAETGAGKSTQVPQFLMDAGYDVVVTQPRRLAARTLAERVAEENSSPLGKVVGYRTAHEHSWSDETRCLFVTDGLQMVNELLGRRKKDSKLVLCLDEVHEWNLNIEVLVAWVRKRVTEDPSFKAVIMSATLEAERLSEFFNDVPVISVPGRLFPVTKQTTSGVLVNDVIKLAQDGRNVLVFQPGKPEIEEVIESLNKQCAGMFEILPLHGELDSVAQKKCFKHYGRPKIVVATNVAQTSITIDDIDAVVDSGLERRKELVGGVEGLYIKPISLADSKQREGRAGRTKPGIYIDVLKADRFTHEDRAQFPKAEIERVRLDQTVLRLAEVGVDMENLSFFHQPDLESIHKAKEDLKKLGCMNEDGRVTDIGRKVAKLPTSVMFGRMIIEADKLGVVEDIISIAAIMEFGQLHARKDENTQMENYVWRRFVDDEEKSDPIAQLNLYKKSLLMDKAQMREAGIHLGYFSKIREARKHLESAVKKHVKDYESTGPRELVLKALIAGMVNNLYKQYYGRYTTITDITPREISRDSVVRSNTAFAVALPFDLEIKTKRGPRVLNMVRMVSEVDIKSLVEIAPQLVKVEKNVSPYWSEGRQCVVSVTQKSFDNNVFEEEVVYDKDHPDAGELKVAWMFENYGNRFNEEVFSLHSEEAVPPVKDVVIGKHPNTGEDVVGYRTFVYSFGEGKSVVTRTYSEAVAKMEDFCNEVERYRRLYAPRPSISRFAPPPVVVVSTAFGDAIHDAMGNPMRNESALEKLKRESKQKKW